MFAQTVIEVVWTTEHFDTAQSPLIDQGVEVPINRRSTDRGMGDDDTFVNLLGARVVCGTAHSIPHQPFLNCLSFLSHWFS
jgi:hypothetical protein